jgi:hypothetical protein
MIVTVNGYSVTKEAYDSLSEKYGISIITILLIGDYSDKIFEVNEYGAVYIIIIKFDEERKLITVERKLKDI